MLERQFSQTMKMIITISSNKIKEQNQITNGSNRKIKVLNGKKREVIVSFGKMRTKEAKNSSNNRHGMILTNFLILIKVLTIKK